MSSPGHRPAGAAAPPEPAIESYQLPQLIRDLRTYQAELESQNKVLRYSQSMAEAASEARKTTAAATSCALMSRPIGVRRRTAFRSMRPLSAMARTSAVST